MDKKQIGFNAGIIWHYLETSSNKSCSYRELQSALGLSSRSLNQALGWLSHDNQISMDEQAERISLYACPYF